MDLIAAFALGVGAASFEHLRGPMIAILPVVGFMAKMASDALVRKVSLVQGDEAKKDLPKFKRPTFSKVATLIESDDHRPVVVNKHPLFDESSKTEVDDIPHRPQGVQDELLAADQPLEPLEIDRPDVNSAVKFDLLVSNLPSSE